MHLFIVIVGLLLSCAPCSLQVEPPATPSRMPNADGAADGTPVHGNYEEPMPNCVGEMTEVAMVGTDATGSVAASDCGSRMDDLDSSTATPVQTETRLWMPPADDTDGYSYLPCCRERMPHCTCTKPDVACPGPQSGFVMPRADEMVVVPMYLPCPKQLALVDSTEPSSRSFMPRAD